MSASNLVTIFNYVFPNRKFLATLVFDPNLHSTLSQKGFLQKCCFLVYLLVSRWRPKQQIVQSLKHSILATNPLGARVLRVSTLCMSKPSAKAPCDLPFGGLARKHAVDHGDHDACWRCTNCFSRSLHLSEIATDPPLNFKDLKWPKWRLCTISYFGGCWLR